MNLVELYKNCENPLTKENVEKLLGNILEEKEKNNFF